jgi:type II secretory pathway pseudopilin PulG
VREVLTGPLRAYTRIVELLVVGVIVGMVVVVVWPAYVGVRESAYITTCLSKLNGLGLALDMYRMDHADYPPAGVWHEALRANIGPLKSGAKPFKCRADPTDAPTSYFYLDDSLIPPEQYVWPATETPWLVDELHHPLKATILWRDHHQTVVDKLEWVRMRNEKYRIGQDIEHPEWMCFVPRMPSVSPAGSP